MTKIKRLIAVVLAMLMIFGSVSVVASAWDATVDDGFTLGVTTKIFRQVDGEWIETGKVNAGETVKARVFLNTDYFTNGGDLLFFYNTDFFSDSYTADEQTLSVNPAVYAGGNYGITGTFYNSLSSANIEGRLVKLGSISQDFADKHNYFAVSVSLAGDKKNQLFLGDEWLCEFDLKVKDDAAAGTGTGDLFALASTFMSDSVKTNYCNVPKGPSFGYNEDVVDMTQWDAVVKVASNPVTLYTTYVEATFDANGGLFAGNKETRVLSGEAGTALDVGTPVLDGYTFEGWVADGTSEVIEDVVALPHADTTYVAQWKSATDRYDETLKFKTDIYRLNDEGEWVYTEKVIPGETVKARIYIDTTYYTNAGDFVVFYDNDFFEETDPNFAAGSYTDLVVNTDAASSAALTDAEGTYALVSADARVIKRLIEAGHIDQAFADSHTAYLATYKFNPSTSQKLSGEYYFAEWVLKVKDDATGEGDFFVVEETIQNASEAGQKAYISIPLSVEGGTDEDSISLFEVNINTDVESHPVTTISRINFDANGGEFATGETTFVIEGDIADPVDAATIPEVTNEGYTFKGWVPAELENPTVDDVVEVPAEIPFDELNLKALWIKEVDITIDPSNGDAVITETVTAGDEFVKPEDPAKEGHYLAGWVDGEGNFMKELPDVYPEADTTYTAVFETYTYAVEYYVLNTETLVFDRVSTVNTPYGDEIISVPPSYTVPEGHVLTPAYKDISFSTLLAEGETMPANNVQLYYKAVPNSYPATFDLDGGNIDGNTEDVVVNTVYGQQIKAPADPVKEGHTFTGWAPMVGMMDSEGADFVATWEVNTYDATYIVDGEVYEVYDIPYGSDLEYPADPILPGYNFVEWNPDIPDAMPAEDLEFVAVFEKKDITITLDLNGGEYDGSADDIVIEGKYGDAVEAPDTALLEKEGYTFGGWDPALPGTLPEEDATYTAIWNAKKDTPYEVWVYLQTTEGTYPDDADQVIEMTGETDTLVNVAVPTPYGFVPSTTMGDYGKDVTIAADGSTVYKVYFERETYTITFDGNGGLIDGEATVSDEYLYLSSVTAPADPFMEGNTFTGWAPSVDSEATKAVTYVAQWKVNSYDVNYMIKGEDGADDTTFLVESFNYGDALTVTTDKPVKYGYNFGGWVDADGNSYKFPATMPAEDITVYAKFTAKSDLVAEFYEEADSETPYDTTTADFDAAVTAPESEPEKEGYEFGGWSADGVTPIDFAAGTEIMDSVDGKKYYAIWNAATQEIPVEYYYMDTDGTYPDAPDKTEKVNFKTGETATVTPAEEENYTVDAEASILEEVVAADGSTVLQVYYKLNTTKLIINVDGEETVIEGLVGSEVPEDKIPDTDKPGYDFNGWVDEDGNPVDVPTTMPEEDTTIKADYTVKVYNVTFIVDGEVYDGPTATEYGAPIVEPSVPTKVGYSFAGWLDDEDKKPDDYGVMPDSDLEFTAQWTADENIGYVLEVYEMGTDGTYPSTPTTTYNFNDGVVGDDRTVTPTVPTGFVLDVETTATPEKSELTGTIPATGTLVLKAYYERSQYTLYIDIDGEVTEEVYYYGESVADRDDPVKKGWTFTSWTPDMPKVMPAEDVTVVAQFTKNSYTATFDAGEGVFDDGESVATSDVPYAESITAPADEPVKEGYVFAGWSKDGETVITNLGKMDDDGETFIAVWEKAAVTVTFYNYLPSEKGPAVPEGQATYVYDQKTDYLFGDTIVFPADPVIQGHEDHYVFTGWVDADGNAVEAGITAPAADLDIYATYERVKVMLIPKNATCTTVIDRAGLEVDDYTADSEWYVYGLEEILSLKVLLNNYIDVQGDGRIVVTKINDNSNYYGTGSVIDVYDNVTGELVESFTIIIFGDINGDSYANGVDLSIISEEALSLTEWSIEGTDEYRAYKVKAANLRPDIVIDGQDKALLNQHVLSLGEINQVTGLVEF